MTLLHLALIALTVGTAPAAAADTVLDYRKPSLRDGRSSSSEAERARVARALAEEATASIREDMGRSFAILGDSWGPSRRLALTSGST